MHVMLPANHEVRKEMHMHTVQGRLTGNRGEEELKQHHVSQWLCQGKGGKS